FTRAPIFSVLLISRYVHHLLLHSLPTRRSSDLLLSSLIITQGFLADGVPTLDARAAGVGVAVVLLVLRAPFLVVVALAAVTAALDRKSTRLNSSHVKISYAVFCLKKKTVRTCYR